MLKSISARDALQTGDNLTVDEIQDLFLNEISQGSRVLFIGCGSGKGVSSMSDKGYQMTGLDVSEEEIQTARGSYLGTEFMCKNIQNFQFDEETFAGIWADKVLKNLSTSELPYVLEGLSGALISGGHIYVTLQTGQANDMQKLLENAGFTVKNTYHNHTQLRFLCVKN